MGGPPLYSHTKQPHSEVSIPWLLWPAWWGCGRNDRCSFENCHLSSSSAEHNGGGGLGPRWKERRVLCRWLGLKATRLVPVLTHFHQCQASTKLGHRTNVGLADKGGKGGGAQTSSTPLWKSASTKMVINSRRLFLAAQKTGHLFAGPWQYWLDHG